MLHSPHCCHAAPTTNVPLIANTQLSHRKSSLVKWLDCNPWAIITLSGRSHSNHLYLNPLSPSPLHRFGSTPTAGSSGRPASIPIRWQPPDCATPPYSPYPRSKALPNTTTGWTPTSPGMVSPGKSGEEDTEPRRC